MLEHLAAAIENKYGGCADTAVTKATNNTPESFIITRWDEDIAGEPQPEDSVLLTDTQAYIDNVLPDLIEEDAEHDRLNKKQRLALRTLVLMGRQINAAQPGFFDQEVKDNLQELNALLRGN